MSADLSLVTNQLLEEFDALDAAATPGPWEAPTNSLYRGVVQLAGSRDQVALATGTAAMYDERASTGDVIAANAQLIARSREVVPLFVATIRKLEADLAEMAHARWAAENELEREQALHKLELAKVRAEVEATRRETGDGWQITHDLPERVKMMREAAAHWKSMLQERVVERDHWKSRVELAVRREQEAETQVAVMREPLSEALDLVPGSDHWKWREEAHRALASDAGRPLLAVRDAAKKHAARWKWAAKHYRAAVHRLADKLALSEKETSVVEFMRNVWRVTAMRSDGASEKGRAIIAELEQRLLANETSWQACQADRAALQDDKDHLLDAIDKDATGLADALGGIVKVIESRHWVTDSRGAYEWDDERYMTETYDAFQAVLKLAQPALTQSGTRAAEAWRTFERGRIIKLRAEVAELKPDAERWKSAYVMLSEHLGARHESALECLGKVLQEHGGKRVDDDDANAQLDRAAIAVLDRADKAFAEARDAKIKAKP